MLAFLALWQGNQARRELAAAVLIGILVVRLTRCFARFVLGPESSGERIISLTQAGARYFYDGAVRIAFVGVVVFVVAYLIGVLVGECLRSFAADGLGWGNIRRPRGVRGVEGAATRGRCNPLDR